MLAKHPTSWQNSLSALLLALVCISLLYDISNNIHTCEHLRTPRQMLGPRRLATIFPPTTPPQEPQRDSRLQQSMVSASS